MHDERPRASGEGALRRRDFLERTAYAAGLTGMATLPAGTLLHEAAAAQAAALPARATCRSTTSWS